MLLADAAQVVGGKLYILGGGWNVTGPDPIPFAIAMLIYIPWDQTNRRIEWRLKLLTEDGQVVQVATPMGNRPIEMTGGFEVGRPPGVKPGTTQTVPLAINVGPLPLQAGRRYVWALNLDGVEKEDWTLVFDTRPARE